MRYNLLKPSALLLLTGLASLSSLAQHDAGTGKNKGFMKDETVIIKKEHGSGKTVVEIKDGTVYINGEAVVTVHDADAAKVHKKVIIEDGDEGRGRPRVQAFNFSPDDEEGFKDMPAPRNANRAMLGVMTDPKSGKIGALVKDVTPGSAAETAGLKSGDVITRIDGKAIKDAGALVSEIGAQHEPGDKVTINYERNGEEHTATAKLQRAEPQASTRSFSFGPDINGDMPNSMFKGFPFLSGEDYSPAPKIGVSVEDRADGAGVRVLNVKPGSAGAEAGLKEGDIITRLGDEKIGSVDELQLNLQVMRRNQKASLEYQRDRKANIAELKFPKNVKRKDL